MNRNFSAHSDSILAIAVSLSKPSLLSSNENNSTLVILELSEHVFLKLPDLILDVTLKFYYVFLDFCNLRSKISSQLIFLWLHKNIFTFPQGSRLNKSNFDAPQEMTKSFTQQSDRG